jgi:hypothetical protein
MCQLKALEKFKEVGTQGFKQSQGWLGKFFK